MWSVVGGLTTVIWSVVGFFHSHWSVVGGFSDRWSVVSGRWSVVGVTVVGGWSVGSGFVLHQYKSYLLRLGVGSGPRP